MCGERGRPQLPVLPSIRVPKAQQTQNNTLQFVPPRRARTAAAPRRSFATAQVLGKSRNATGVALERSLTTAELTAQVARRGTPFSPFSVQIGQARPERVLHDAPWDKTKRQVTEDALWREPGETLHTHHPQSPIRQRVWEDESSMILTKACFRCCRWQPGPDPLDHDIARLACPTRGGA